MSATWPIHPAAELFPMLADDELAQLADDITEHGLHEPVTLWRDPERGTVLLDGRNRLAACERADVEVRTRTYEGDDPTGFVISENVRRRHLTPGQLAAIAHDALPLFEAQAKRRRAVAPTKANRKRKESVGRSAHTPTSPHRAREDAAKSAGTSGRGVARFKRLAETAPDLAEKVRAGTLALDRAERIIRDRDAEARKVAEAKAAARRTKRAPRVDVRHGDLRDVLDDIPEGSVHAVITDPPYPREFLPLYEDLAKLADRVLVPGGVLAVLSGQMHLPEVMARLDVGRPYRWACALLTKGPGYVAHARKVQSSWKPLLLYGGGPRLGDLFSSEGATDNAKSLHRWGQDYGAFVEIVNRLTKPGQTVLDPFMGSGTTLLAAHAGGRHVIGCDTDEAAVATATERLAP